MSDFGRFSLFIAAGLCSLSIIADLLTMWKKDTRLAAVGRYGTIGLFLCLTSAVIILLRLLLNDDFSVGYVATYSSRGLPVLQKFCALWSGAGGALLLWLCLQVGFVSVVFFKNPPDTLAFSSRGRSISNFVCAFLFQALIHEKQPFAILSVTAADGGAGGDLPVHLAMIFYPLFLIVGFAALIIPFAWAFSFFKSDPNVHVKTMLCRVRGMALFACCFLTLGILLGAWGRYEEYAEHGYQAGQVMQGFVFDLPIIPWVFAILMFLGFCIYSSRAHFGMYTAIMSVLTYSLCVYGGLDYIALGDSGGGEGKFVVIMLIHVWIIAAIMLVRRHFRKTAISD